MPSKPIGPRQQPKFAGIKTFLRLPHTRCLDGVDVAVVGIPWDGSATYLTGQRHGPDAIRRMSATLRPYNMELDVEPFAHLNGVDYGDLTVVAGYVEETYARVEAELQPLLAAGVVPLGLGGDHSITLPELRALAAAGGPLALVHFDSHVDTSDHYFGQPYYHGSPFRRAVEEGLILPQHTIQLGMHGSTFARDAYADSRALGFEVITLNEMRRMGSAAVLAAIRARVGTMRVFVTVDIDIVDPAYAPGTGTPEVGGLTSWETMQLMQGLAGLNFAGFDVVEVLPDRDPADITALLAANLINTFMALVASARQGQ